MKIHITTLENGKAGEADLPEEIFRCHPPRPDIMARVCTGSKSKRRSGNHKVKGMGEVSGTTKKPYKQKGRVMPPGVRSRAPQFRTGAPCTARSCVTMATICRRRFAAWV